MADNIIGDMIPEINTTQILDIVLWGIIGILILGVIGYLAWWWFRKRKYREFKVVIWERDQNGNVHESYDKAGIFIDRHTGHKLLFLQRAKKGLNPNNPPFVTSRDRKGRLVKTVYLRKVGVSNYRYCHVTIAKDGTILRVGEEDVNWAAQDIEKIRRTFNKESWWKQHGSQVIWIIAMLLISITLISLFNKMEVIGEASKTLLEVAEVQNRIAETLLNISKQPNMNPGQPIIVGG